jgi:hypothetical protein
MKVERKDAKRALVFQITKDDVVEAKRHDKNQCVIAKAVAALPGILGVSVGASIVQVKTVSGIQRYATPLKLKQALTRFDETGFWKLPAGVYVLNPPPPCLTKDRLAQRNHIAGNVATRGINPRTGKAYGTTGRIAFRQRQINPRVLEFMKIKKATKAALRSAAA